MSRFKVDDVIQAKVINVNKSDKKIGLSVRKLEESDDKEIYNNYLNSKMEATSNLGELLREMQNQQESADEEETSPSGPDEAASDDASEESMAEEGEDGPDSSMQ